MLCEFLIKSSAISRKKQRIVLFASAELTLLSIREHSIFGIFLSSFVVHRRITVGNIFRWMPANGRKIGSDVTRDAVYV